MRSFRLRTLFASALVSGAAAALFAGALLPTQALAQYDGTGDLKIDKPEDKQDVKPVPAPEGAISEAVETAKTFCGSEAPGFVNGILAAALRDINDNPEDP